MNTDLDYFPSIKAKKLYTQIVEQFVDLIKRGEFKAGHKLPSERTLSQKLSVSRTSLREALIAMHMMGLVEIKPNQGAYITEKGVPPILKEVNYLNMGESPFQILQARKAIEPNLAAIAATFRNQNSMNEIEEILSLMENNLSCHQVDGSFFNAHDCAFHLAIAKTTQNPILVGMGYIINNLMKQELWINLLNDTINSTKLGQQAGLFDHKEIYKAIKLRKPQVASAAMKAHLLRVEKLAKKAVLLAHINPTDGKSSGISGQAENEIGQNARQKILIEREVK